MQKTQYHRANLPLSMQLTSDQMCPVTVRYLFGNKVILHHFNNGLLPIWNHAVELDRDWKKADEFEVLLRQVAAEIIATLKKKRHPMKKKARTK